MAQIFIGVSELGKQALQSGQINEVKKFLSNISQPTLIKFLECPIKFGSDYLTPFQYSIKMSFNDIAMLLINTEGYNLDIFVGCSYDNNSNVSALWMASSFNRIEILKFLIQKRCNIEHCASSSDVYPMRTYSVSVLNEACKKGHIESICILLSANANPNNNYSLITSPFKSILSHNDPNLLEVFLIYSKDRLSINDPLDLFYIPITYASEFCGLRLIQLLINYGSNINSIDQHGSTCTCLMRAILSKLSDKKEVIKYLLENMNKELISYSNGSLHGYNVLHIAIKQAESIDLIKMLLKAGIDINSKDRYGKSPIELSIEFNRSDIITEYNLMSVSKLNESQQIINELTSVIDHQELEINTLHDRTREKDNCVICLNENADTAAINCGHIFGCFNCAQKLRNGQCPICKSKISGLLKVYHP